MIGGKTLAKVGRTLQDRVFHALRMQDVIDRQEQAALTNCMGFQGQWDEHRRFQLAFLEQEGLKPSDRVFELGFGPLTLGVPLIQRLDSGRYFGVDVRASAGDIAYSQVSKFSLSRKNPRLVIAEDFGEQAFYGLRYEKIWSFSLLYHLSDDLVARWFSIVPARLEPDGAYWANINSTVEDSRWLEFPFMKRPPEFYGRLAEANGLSMTVRGALGSLGFRGRGLEKDNLLLEFRPAEPRR